MSNLPSDADRRQPTPGRRSSDLVVDGIVRHVVFLRRIALTAVISWAVIATVACIVILVALGNSEATNSRATKALSQARQNETAIAATNIRLAHEVIGLCGTEKDTRGAVDLAHQVIQNAFLTAGILQLRAASQFAHGISPAVRSEAKIERNFALRLISGARHIEALPVLDCVALAHDPLGYKPPRARPFPTGPKH